MFPTSLLLLLAAMTSVGCNIILTQPNSVVLQPGHSFTLKCEVSGYSVTDNSYAIAWIRHPAGKALEWIVQIWGGGSIYKKDSLANKFSISKSDSSNTVTLNGQNLQSEDTAVYYCARQIRGAFEYWGKGTTVTVTSGADPKPPTVSMMSPCNSTSDSQIVGCLASGFSPAESVSFKWMDQGGNALTDFIQYPTVTIGDKMLKVSHITINKAKLNQRQVMCTAVHPSKTVNETFITVKTQSPTLSLVPVTTPKSTSVMCVIEDFYPKNLTVQWKVNDDSTSPLKLESKLNEDTGLYTAYSFYKVSSETWNANPSYTCEVTHRGKPIIKNKNFKAKFTLTLKPPIERELFVNNKVVLEAVVSGDVKKTVEEASVSCTVKNVPVSNDIKPGNVFFDTSLFIRIHNVTIDTNKWFDGEMVTCTIHDKNNNRDIKQEIHFDKGDGHKPTVTIYRPDIFTNTVSLVCEVTSKKLGNVYIMWKVGNEPYIEGITSAPIYKMDSTSVFSILTMSKDEYEGPATNINCAVKHANMDNKKSPLQVSTSQSKLQECPVYS